jgi:hypothetical protein
VEQMYEFIYCMETQVEWNECMNSSSEDWNVLVRWKQESVSRLQ